MKEFIPETVEDILTWMTPKGVNNSKFFESPQSWAKLRHEAVTAATAMGWLQEYKDLLRFFILVAPHRATKNVIAVLDEKFENRI